MQAKNFNALGRVNALQRAVMKLSFDGYVVLKTNTTEGRASIQIDRPLEGVQAQLSHHAEKTIASVDYLGCRVYWFVEQEAAA